MGVEAEVGEVRGRDGQTPSGSERRYDGAHAGGAADAPPDRVLAAHGMAGLRPPPPPEPLVALSMDEMHEVAARLSALAAAESTGETIGSEPAPPAPGT